MSEDKGLEEVEPSQFNVDHQTESHDHPQKNDSFEDLAALDINAKDNLKTKTQVEAYRLFLDEKKESILYLFLFIVIICIPVTLVLKIKLASQVFTCPRGSYCSKNVFVYDCLEGFYGAELDMTNMECSGPCEGGYYCPAGSVSAQENICPKGHYCPPGSAAPILCEPGRYGGIEGLSSSNCSGFCDPGYYCLEGSVSRNENICEKGYYCLEGTTSRHDYICPQGHYGSEEGLKTSHCSGVCSSSPGKYCKEGTIEKDDFVDCPLGSYCSGSIGVDSRKPCSAGRYGDTIGMIQENCTDECLEGFYCPEGSSSPTQENCSPGYYCPRATPKRLSCPIGRYGSSQNLVESSCDGECSPGYFCPANSTSSTQSLCPEGFYCPAGVANLSNYRCPEGYSCSIGTAIPYIYCSRGHYCPEGTSSPIQYPCPAGTYGGVQKLTNSECSGLCWPGYYCLEGTANPTLKECPAGSYCPEGTKAPRQYLCPSKFWSARTSLYSIEECICEEYECDPDLSGICRMGYYCPEGSFQQTQNVCPHNHYCPTGVDEPILCQKKGYWCGQREFIEKAQPNEAAAILMNNLDRKGELWAEDYPTVWNGLKFQGYSKTEAFIFVSITRKIYTGPTYESEAFTVFTRGLDTLQYNVSLKGFFNVSVFLCPDNMCDAKDNRIHLRDVLKEPAKDDNATAYITNIMFDWEIPRPAPLGNASICMEDMDNNSSIIGCTDTFEIAFAGQVEPVQETVFMSLSVYFLCSQTMVTIIYLLRADTSRDGEVVHLLRPPSTRFAKTLYGVKLFLETMQLSLLVLCQRVYQNVPNGLHYYFGTVVQYLSPSFERVFGFHIAFLLSHILVGLYIGKGNSMAKVSPERQNSYTKTINSKLILSQTVLEWMVLEAFYVPILLSILSGIDCVYTTVSDGFDSPNEFYDEIVLYSTGDIECWSSSHYFLAVEAMLFSTFLSFIATSYAMHNQKHEHVNIIPFFRVLSICGKTTLCYLSVLLVPTRNIGINTIPIICVLLWATFTAFWAHKKNPALAKNRRMNNWIVSFYICLIWGNVCVSINSALNLQYEKTSPDRSDWPFSVFLISAPFLSVAVAFWHNKSASKHTNSLQFKQLANNVDVKTQQKCIENSLSFVALATDFDDLNSMLGCIGVLTQNFQQQEVRHAAISSSLNILKSNLTSVENVAKEGLIDFEIGNSSPFRIHTDYISFAVTNQIGDYVHVHPTDQFKLLQSLFSHLVVADLSKQHLGDDEAATIALILREHPVIKVCSLEGNNIGIQGIKLLIGSISVNESLTTLKLGNNNFSSEELFRIHDTISDAFLARYYMSETLPRFDFGDVLLIRFIPEEFDLADQEPGFDTFNDLQKEHLKLLGLGTEDDELSPEYVSRIVFETKETLPESCEKEIRSVLLRLAIMRIPISIICRRSNQENAKLAIGNAILLNKDDVDIQDPNLRFFKLSDLELRPFKFDQDSKKVELKPGSMTPSEFEIVRGLVTIDSNLETISITDNSISIKNASRLGEVLSENSTIETLFLSSTPLNIQILRGKGEHKNIEYIVPAIVDTEATIIFTILARNNTVEKLCIYSTAEYRRSNNAITDTIGNELKEFLVKNRSVRKLSLGSEFGGNTLSYRGVSLLFEGLKRHRQLVSLDLRNNPIGPKSCLPLSEYLKYPEINLQSLKLDNCNILDEGCVYLAKAIEYNRSLRKLFLSSNKIRKDGLVILLTKLGMKSTSLNTLVLDDNDLSEVGNELGSMIKRNQSIERLSVSSCEIIGSPSLCEALGSNSTLLKLNIADNKRINPDKMLEFVSRNKHISCLNMQSCLVQDSAVKTLVTALQASRSLTVLDLSDNKITDIGAQKILELCMHPQNSFSSVSLRQNFNITLEIREEFAKLDIMIDI